MYKCQNYEEMYEMYEMYVMLWNVCIVVEGVFVVEDVSCSYGVVY